MEIKCNVDELRKKSLFIATPMYGGMCYGMYMKSCLDLQGTCAQYGIPARYSFLFNESLIQRARNYLTDEFLHRSDCTHMLFIDADISFNPQDIIAMLALDKDIIGIPYSKKSINWDNIKKAILKKPDIEAGELSKLIGSSVMNPVAGTKSFNVTEPIQVMEIGTGLTLYSRNVFEKLEEAYPEYKYKPDHVGSGPNFDGSREIMSFFNVYIDPDSRRTLSEDYALNQMCQKIGIETWMMPWCQTIHNGTYGFENNLPAIANYIGEL